MKGEPQLEDRDPTAGDTDDEDDELDESQYRAVKDAILFAIHISPSMLRSATNPPDDGKNQPQFPPAIAALKTAYELMQQRIISNPKDMIGILLFGTERTKFSREAGDGASMGNHGYPHCYLLNDLDIPEANDVRRLKDLIEDEEESREILVASKDQVSMSNMLFCANQIFTTRAPNFSSRRLFIVTNEDNPHAKSRDLQSAAIVRAKDLYDLGVTIELFPIVPAGQAFDFSRFYGDIIYDVDLLERRRTADVIEDDGLSLLRKLLSSVASKVSPRRTLFSHVPLELGPGLRIGVKGYTMIKKQEVARSHYVHMGGEKAVIAQGKTTQVADATSRVVKKTEIRHGYRFGGQQISFTTAEMAALRNFGEPVIRLIGFRPLASLPIWAYTKHATFIFPSEEDFVGSTRTFAALHQSMLKKRLYGLMWFIARRNAGPVLAAMLASDTGSSNGEPDGTHPAGLWLIPLPFADDVRPDPEVLQSVPRASEALVEKMRIIVEQLQLPRGHYDPSKYNNPALQWHYRILQAMALEEELPEKAQDTTIPKYRQIDKRVGEYAMSWAAELEAEYARGQSQYKNGSADGTKTSLPKRPAASEGEGAPASKRPATSRAMQEGDAPTDKEVKVMNAQGTLNKLSLPQLKGLLARQRLSTKGKKAELMESIQAHFEKL